METQLRRIKGFDEIEKKIISIEKSAEIKNTYSNDIGSLIETNKDDYDHTQFTWLSLETLKNYIAILEEVGKINQKEITGIRIYFAKYPESGDYSNKEIENLKPGRETFFFAPTMLAEDNELNKKYPILQNVPFSIKFNGDDKYIGGFEEILALKAETKTNNSLQNLKTNTSKQSFSFTLDDISNTSIMMNDLMSFPPPKQGK
jgi:hypothetical protein